MERVEKSNMWSVSHVEGVYNIKHNIADIVFFSANQFKDFYQRQDKHPYGPWQMYPCLHTFTINVHLLELIFSFVNPNVHVK